MINNRFKKSKIWLIVSLCIVMCISLTACSSKDKENETYESYVYYINKSVTKIVSKEYSFKAKDDEGKVEELIEQLSLNTDDVEVTKAIPEGVFIAGYALGDGVLSLDFNTKYAELSKSQEVLTRAAIVLTMTQLNSIGQVSFSVAGEPLKNASGENVGYMEASDFADNLDSNKAVYNTETFTVYFANQTGDKLSAFEFEAEYSSNNSKEQLIINKLLEGPGDKEGYLRTLPEGIIVDRIYTNYNTCYVMLAENFASAQTSVLDEVVIYSIVNSLTELSYISQVQITIKGATDEMYHGNILLSEPLKMNLDIIEKKE